MSASDTLLSLRGILYRLLLSCLVISPVASAGEAVKVLHVDSYHRGFAWSTGIAEGIGSRLLVENVWFKTVYLDAWRYPSSDAVIREAERIRQSLSELEPDVVITSDDAAAKYMSGIATGYPGTRFVFSGVNWNAEKYAFPADRVTGIVEVPLIHSLVDLLSRYAKGDRIGYLSLDTLSGRIDLERIPQRLERPLELAFLVEDLDQWKRRFRELQDSVDMLILNAPEDADGWDLDEMRDFARRETRIPTGSTYESHAMVSLICMARIPQEQGWWAADAALKIMSGTAPSDIPVSTNKEGRLIVNLDLAQELDITISQDILEIADILKAPPQ